MSELDSVRGIAAFVVLLHHVWEVILPDQNSFPLRGYPIPGSGLLGEAAFWVSVSPLRLLFCGHSAVGLFFVLSGFALTKSLQSTSHDGYPSFVVRRFFRIYPPFALVILIAAACSSLIAPVGIPGRDWLNEYWCTPVTFDLVLGHLAMIDTSGLYNSLDSSMWTLVHEMRVSLIFPLLAALAFVHPRRVLAGAIALFALLSITHLTAALGAHLHPELAREIVLSLVQTLRYVMFFVFGIILATKHDRVESLLVRHEWTVKYLWVGALVLLAIPYTKGYTEICYAVGAFILLALCMHSPSARAFLRHRVLQWLGKISYSLYLVHLVVLLAVVWSLNGVLPIGWNLLIGLLGSLVVADLLNRAVELPSGALGKRLGARLGVLRGRRRQQVFG